MTNDEIQVILGKLFDSLADQKTGIRELTLIALATKETLVHLHPEAAEFYEKAYRDYASATAETDNAIISGWRSIASELNPKGL